MANDHNAGSAVNVPTFWELDSGRIHRYLGTAIIDNEPGWFVVKYYDGSLWAYAPMHIAWLTGEIAREIQC